jgi:hypothetical protein
VISLAFIGPSGLGVVFDAGAPVVWDVDDVCAATTVTGWADVDGGGDLIPAAAAWPEQAARVKTTADKAIVNIVFPCMLLFSPSVV